MRTRRKTTKADALALAFVVFLVFTSGCTPEPADPRSSSASANPSEQTATNSQSGSTQAPNGHTAEDTEAPFVIGKRFVEEPAFRREVLERSLAIDHEQMYAKYRLDHYAGGDNRWDKRKVYNPKTRPILWPGIEPSPDGPTAETWSDIAFEEVYTHDALMAAGREAFQRYPVQIDEGFAIALESSARAEMFGLWQHDGQAGGLLEVQFDNGSTGLASTCSTCHGSVVDGELVLGRANADLNRGGMAVLAGELRGGDPAKLDELHSWGPGRVDTTPDQTSNPTAIPDLRPVRYQSRLHATGSVYNGLAELAVRTDTLIITSHNGVVRPPPYLTFALTYFMWHLSPEDRSADPAPPEAFVEHCSGCHDSAVAPSKLVAPDVLKIDAAVANSPSRGTGKYRVPSLAGVSKRSQLLHTAVKVDLKSFFEPSRLEMEPGHPFGVDLGDADKKAILGYLRSL